MFEYIRKHTKVVMVVLVFLIVPSFVLVGMNSYTSAVVKGETVAKVAGTTITKEEWDFAHKQQVDRMRASMPSLDANLLETPEARYVTLERLVRERVLSVAADKSKFWISDAKVASELASDPTIAELRDQDGKLDMEQYRRILGSQGMTTTMFEANVRSNMAVQQVMGAFATTGFSSNSQADIALDAYFQRREIQVAMFKAEEFASKVVLTDADYEAYYQQNKDQYQMPEQASIEYVVLDLESVETGIKATDEEIKLAYEDYVRSLDLQETRRASHILIEVPQSASASDREKAKAKADEIAALVQAKPENFAALAKEHSQDKGSAVNGGDLDFFARGAMVKPFEDAVFSIKKGEISPVVATDFGYHIIQLTDIKAAPKRTFDEMRTELEGQVKKQHAQTKFAEAADIFDNEVFDQPDSLQPVIEKLKLTLKKADAVAPTPSVGATGALANTEFLNALFSDDAISKKRNTKALELGQNQRVSGRVVLHTPARTLSQEEVKDKIKVALIAERSAKFAQQEGVEKLSVWQNSTEKAKFQAPLIVSRDATENQLPQIIEATFVASTDALPTLKGVDLGSQGYAIVKLNKVEDRAPESAEALAKEYAQYQQALTTAETQAYYLLLQDRFRAKIEAPKP